MLLETLVLSVCIQGAGCNEATKAYYTYNKGLQAWVGHIQRQVETQYGKENLALLGTAAGLIFVKQGTINIDKHSDLIIAPDQAVFEMHWDF